MDKAQVNFGSPRFNEKTLDGPIPVEPGAQEGHRENESFLRRSERSPVVLSGNLSLGKGISLGHIEFLDEALAAILQENGINQLRQERVSQELSRVLYDGSDIFFGKKQSPGKEIKHVTTGSSNGSLIADLREILTGEIEKVFHSDKLGEGEIYYLKGISTGHKPKTQIETLEEEPWSTSTVKPFREPSEMLANNLVNKNHPTSVVNSSNKNILEDQVLDQVVKYARLNLREGISEIEIHLKPELLGSLRIKVVMEGKEIGASFFADTPLVREIIQNHLPDLKQAFLAQNLDINKFSVFAGYHQGRENMDTNNSRDFFKNKESHRNREDKKCLSLQELGGMEYNSLSLIDCFV
jgi:hypothetical protein